MCGCSCVTVGAGKLVRRGQKETGHFHVSILLDVRLMLGKYQHLITMFCLLVHWRRVGGSPPSSSADLQLTGPTPGRRPHLKGATWNDTVGDGEPFQACRPGFVIEVLLLATEQWDSQKAGGKKCKRRPRGRTFQTPVQSRANKVSVTLNHARSRFPFFFFLSAFLHFSEAPVGPALCLWGSLSSSGCSVSGSALFNVTHTALLSVSGLFFFYYYEPFTVQCVPFFFFFATFLNSLTESLTDSHYSL